MTLSPSKHTIVSRVRGRDEHVALNLLSGAADLLSPEEAAALEGEGEGREELAARGYLARAQDEAAREREAYLTFLDRRDSEEIQLFFAPSYACNFGCSYCYQAEYPAPAPQHSREIVDAFFRYVDAAFAGRRKYITLFGGEPLLPGATYRAAVEHLVDGARARDLELAVVTNGYHLTDYLDALTRARIREIQVTLDGVGATHDARRSLKGGGPTFDRIVSGIDATLARGVAVNLRVVVDRDNLAHLPALASFAIAKGWTKNRLFKTQLGRNYELHYCQVGTERLYSRLELHEALYDLVQRHPEVLEFHRPAFSLARTLVDRGELPEPLFDACPGCKTEWAFDYTGKIYPCTATVGKPGEEVGTFFPEASLDRARAADWEERDVFAIPECRDCPVQLACGGGCAAVAKNRTGRLHAPDCRPVRELLELGMGLYLDRRPPPAAEPCCTPAAGDDTGVPLGKERP